MATGPIIQIACGTAAGHPAFGTLLLPAPLRRHPSSGRYSPVVALGLLIVAVGLFLAMLPLQAARVTHWGRFAGYSSDPGALRYYRVAGVVLVTVGVILAVVLG